MTTSNRGLVNAFWIALAVAIGVGIGTGWIRPNRVAVTVSRSVPGVAYSDARYTALVFIRSTCHFCAESMPFYRDLVTRARRPQIQVVFTSDEPVPIVRQYLELHGVPPERIATVSFLDYGVAATPTIIVVDSSGYGTTRWIGRLDAAREAALLATVSDTRRQFGWRSLIPRARLAS